MRTELIFCPACNHKLRVPDDLMGEEVECPKCATLFVAPPPSDAIMPGERVNPTSRPRPEYGDRYEEDEEWDNRPRRRAEGPSTTAPGIFLMIVGGLGLLSSAGRIAILVFAPQVMNQAFQNNPFGKPAPGMNMELISMIFGVIFMIMSLITLCGAVGLLKRKMYWLAIIGSFMAIFNLSDFCCLLGAPAGIWALVVLFNADTKATFS